MNRILFTSGYLFTTSVILGLLIFSSMTCAQDNIPMEDKLLRVGYFYSEPRAMLNKLGVHDGVDIRYFKLITEKMGIKNVQFEVFPISRLLESVNRGEIDIALSFAGTKKRLSEGKYRFPKTPLWVSEPTFLVKDSHPLKEVNSVEDILHLKIGWIAGAYIPEILRDKRLTLINSFGNDPVGRNMEKVVLDRIDTTYVPVAQHVSYYASKMGISGIRLVASPEEPLAFYPLMSKNTSDEFIRRYDKVRTELHKTLPYHQAHNDFLRTIGVDFNLMKLNSQHD